MNFNNYTIKAQDAVQQAQLIAERSQNQSIETLHLYKGIETADESVLPFLLKKLGAEPARISREVDNAITALPKVSGGEQFLSNDASNALKKAETFLKEFGDEFVSIELMLLGILAIGDHTSSILKNQCVSI